MPTGTQFSTRSCGCDVNLWWEGLGNLEYGAFLTRGESRGVSEDKARTVDLAQVRVRVGIGL